MDWSDWLNQRFGADNSLGDKPAALLVSVAFLIMRVLEIQVGDALDEGIATEPEPCS